MAPSMTSSNAPSHTTVESPSSEDDSLKSATSSRGDRSHNDNDALISPLTPNTMSFSMTAPVMSSPSEVNLPDIDLTASGPASFQPIAICGMACRLPGGIACPQELWDFLIAKKDARMRVPESRYNIKAYYSAGRQPGTIISEHGYFLDTTVDLGAIDTSFFAITRAEAEHLDPQQKLLLEVAREAIDEAGETDWRGGNIGAYVGNFGQDWYDMTTLDPQNHGVHQISEYSEFALANRLSYAMDLRGPRYVYVMAFNFFRRTNPISMNIRTGCSAALIGLNEACLAINRGDCKSAIVGGTNILMSPGYTSTLSEYGVLSSDGSCKVFAEAANGYARGEAVSAIFVKPLRDALRDGNPVRAVISGVATNHDGKTNGISVPSANAHEAVMRRAYAVSGTTTSEAIGRSGYMEMHGTGTPTGDPIEAEAVSRVFGREGIHIGSVKANLGHSEGASGLTSLIKAVLALEHRTIPPQIKALPLSSKIPWKTAKLTVPEELVPWPKDRYERASVNSFGIGGSNAHVVLDSADSCIRRIKSMESESRSRQSEHVKSEPQLLLFSAKSPATLETMMSNYDAFIKEKLGTRSLADLAYTLAHRRERLPCRGYAIASFPENGLTSKVAAKKAVKQSSTVFMFTGQGAQWPAMGAELFNSTEAFRNSIQRLDHHLSPIAGWSLVEELHKTGATSRVMDARFSQPLCTAIQIAMVDALLAVDIRPAAVVGHSSGEIAAAYAAGALSADQALLVAFYRGVAADSQRRPGAMLAVGLSWREAERHLRPGVVIACDNSPASVTLSGDVEPMDVVANEIRTAHPDALVRFLKVDKAYHSHHMAEVGSAYLAAMSEVKASSKDPSVAFYSSITGTLLEDEPGESPLLGPQYWRRNLESPVRFREAVTTLVSHTANPVFIEIGPHAALGGPLRQILAAESLEAPHISTMLRQKNTSETFLSAIGELWSINVPISPNTFIQGKCLVDLPRYPWDHAQSYWAESRVSKETRFRAHRYHDLLGIKTTESTTLEPIWRNVFHLDNASWVRDHVVKGSIVFPFVGYISMAAEAIRQITDIQDSVTIQGIKVSTALVLDASKPAELVTTFRRRRLTDVLDSAAWWEFTIASHNGFTWTKHCVGQVRADTKTPPQHGIEAAPLPRSVLKKKLYKTFTKAGLEFGPQFQSLDGVTTSTRSEYRARGRTRNDWHGDIVTPVVIDACLQLLCWASNEGQSYDYRQGLPVGIESLKLYRCRHVDELYISGQVTPVANGFEGSARCGTQEAVYLEMDTVTATMLDDLATDAADDASISGRCEWTRHVDFEDVGSLVLPDPQAQTVYPEIQRAARAALMSAKEWAITTEDDAPLAQRVATLLSDVESGSQRTPQDGIPINSRKDLHAVLSQLSMAAQACLQTDVRPFIQALGCSKPCLRVLELESRSVERTRSFLDALTRDDGAILYSRYVCSHSTRPILDRLEKDMGDAKDVEYTDFDIERPLAEQAIATEQFDLIIVTDLQLDATNAHSTVATLKALLGPKGRILIHQIVPEFANLEAIHTTLDTTNTSDTAVLYEKEEWSRLLGENGFDAPTTIQHPGHADCALITQSSVPVMSSRARIATVIRDEASPESNQIIKDLEDRGFRIEYGNLATAVPRGQDVLVLLDLARPFFQDIEEDSFERLKTFLVNLNNSAVFWVTRPSQMFCRDARYAPVIGFARSYRVESGVDFATCETESPLHVARVFDAFHDRRRDGVLDPDMEFAIHEAHVYVNRVHPFSVAAELSMPAESAQSRLSMSKPGRLETLEWVPTSIGEPSVNQVVVEVHACGLNFRDVLVAQNIIELPQTIFGYEGAGIVRKVGSGVKHLRPGDRVVYLGVGTLATTIVDADFLFAKMPDSMTYTDGASVALIFVTAIYALLDIGRLEAGQSILIHSGCGGVGLAAIQIAQMVGAEIYTTVSSQEKTDYLTQHYSIPRNRIFDSRSDAFVDGIMRATDGKGVDLALNSLSGELLHATWRLVADWGTMVEIGKRDLLGGGKLDMRVFLANRNYRCVDIFQMREQRPYMCQKLLQAMLGYYQAGHIRPVEQARVFDMDSCQEAFRYMQRGTHIGKIALEIRKDGSGPAHKQMRQRHETRFDAHAAYLLVGGLGGLGRLVAVWMVQKGARHFVFLSRSAGTGRHDADLLRDLQSMGCRVVLVAGDVTRYEDVSRAVMAATAPLKGVLQLTMILRDEPFPQMTFDSWQTCTQPKIAGTWNLHRATLAHGADLDFMVLASSIVGVFGQISQTNYGAANAFLDAFTQYRARLGLPCSAVQIGSVEGAGVLFENEYLLKRLQAGGWRSVQENELLEALELAMLRSKFTDRHEHHGVNEARSLVDRRNFVLGIAPTVPLSDPNSSARARRDVRMAVYHNVKPTGKATTEGGASGRDSLANLLLRAKRDRSVLKSGPGSGASEADTPPPPALIAATEIGRKLLGLLLRAGEEPDLTLPLAELGMDSMVAIEMRAWWRLTFGFDITVLEMLGAGNLEALGRKAVDGVWALLEAS